jgi:hypothetical protein
LVCRLHPAPWSRRSNVTQPAAPGGPRLCDPPPGCSGAPGAPHGCEREPGKPHTTLLPATTGLEAPACELRQWEFPLRDTRGVFPFRPMGGYQCLRVRRAGRGALPQTPACARQKAQSVRTRISAPPYSLASTSWRATGAHPARTARSVRGRPGRQGSIDADEAPTVPSQRPVARSPGCPGPSDVSARPDTRPPLARVNAAWEQLPSPLRQESRCVSPSQTGGRLLTVGRRGPHKGSSSLCSC